MGLGQAHGAGPFATEQFRQVGVLLLLSAAAANTGDRGLGQARVHAPGIVGRARHFGEEGAEGRGQSLAAIRYGDADGLPAPFAVLAEGVAEPLRRNHPPILEATALLIPRLVQWSQYVLGKFGRVIENGVVEIFGDLLTTTQGRVVLQAKPFPVNKVNVPQWDLVFRHD